MRTAELLRLPRAAVRHTTHLFDDVATAPFDTAAYSRMKFGCGESARKLGREMADAFFSEQRDLLREQRVAVIPAPSTSVPVASTLLARHFAGRLNELLYKEGLPVAEMSHVQRDMRYMNDYAQVAAEVRRELLGQITLYFNREFLEDRALIFVDDVRITGTHEDKLSSALVERRMENLAVFATFAAYVGDDPSIEHRLNRQSVRSALDVARMTSDAGWTVTPRALRMILGAPADERAEVAATLSRRAAESVVHAALITGYHRHESHEEFFEQLRNSLGD